jgi:hypothetical protein
MEVGRNAGPLFGPGAGVQGDLPLPAFLSAGHLMKVVSGLAEGFPDRMFGTAQNLAAAEWIRDQMIAIGLEPAGETFFHEFSSEIAGEKVAGRNVAGILRGTDPKLANEYIVVAGHFDSQQDTKQAANDNATGCAGVLAIAAELARNPPKRSVLFVTFDGEEGVRKDDKYHAGRRGSRHYAEKPPVPLAKTAMLVNMDELGQVHLESGSRKDVFRWASNDIFAQQVLKRATEKALTKDENPIDGYPEQPQESQFFTTDAEPLFRRGVPIVNLLSGRDLANHDPGDDMSRVIPERLEQYIRLAHQCVVEAANHVESLQEMGIVPGGLAPAYTLIRERKNAGLAMIEEEQLRLDELTGRLPAIIAKAQELLTQAVASPIVANAGVDLGPILGDSATWIAEPVLARLRDVRGALVTELHGVDKNDAGARKTLSERIDALASLEDVLSGTLYVSKIGTKTGYYSQRLPEKLADLLRGAERLGLDAMIEGVVKKTDAEVFTADVTADRAIHLARQALAPLGKAIAQAAFALLSPDLAANDERPVTPKDAHDLHDTLLHLASEIVGGPLGGAEAELAQVAGLQAVLAAQIGGVKGSKQKWLADFASTNAFTDFIGQVEALGLGKEQERLAADLEAAIGGAGDLGAAALAFYRPLTAIAFGEAIDSLDALRGLDSDRIANRVERNLANVVRQHEDQQIGLVANEPLVAARLRLSKVVEAALSLAALYDGDALKSTTTLKTVRDRLSAVERAADHPDVSVEIGFWVKWLDTMLPLEGIARDQARQREKVAAEGLAAVQKLWPKVAPIVKEKSGTPVASMDAMAKALFERLAKPNAEDPRAKLGMELLGPMLAAQRALATLSIAPSPRAERELAEAITKLEGFLGEEMTRDLRAIGSRVDKLGALEGVQLGKKERSGPLGILAIRRAQEEA